LREAAEREFLDLDEQEKTMRSALAKLEGGFLRCWRLSIMNDEPETQSSTGGTELSHQGGVKAARKARGQRQDTRTFWFGLGMRGLVGWSVAMPVLVGAGLGFWLDANYPASHSWMLLLMPIGLALGCFNTWRWVSRERWEIRAPEEADDD
jgi:ATP synthase protein I